MSQAAHPAVVTRPLRLRRSTLLLGLGALVVAALVVLALSLGGSNADTTPSVVSDQPALRSDGGPSESAVAASVGAPATATSIPDESGIAAAVSASASGGR